jgi:hypothetical protein
MPVVGFLSIGTENTSALPAPFLQGLHEQGACLHAARLRGDGTRRKPDRRTAPLYGIGLQQE